MPAVKPSLIISAESLIFFCVTSYRSWEVSMRSAAVSVSALACIIGFSLPAPAAVQPCRGPVPMLSRWPMGAAPAHGQVHLDDYDNFRINTDDSGELQNEEMVCVNPLNSNEVVALWRDFRFGYRRVGVGHSTDGGFTWRDDVFPQMYFPWQSDPVLVVDAEGTFTAVMISYDAFAGPGEDGLLTVRSTNGGRTWGDSLFAIVSDPAAFEDKEMLAVDRSNSIYRESLYCVWTRFFGYPNTDSTHIACVRKRPLSSGYSSPVYVSQTTSDQWANVIVGTNGEVYVSWVNYPNQALMFSRSTDGGQTFSPEQVIVQTNFVQAYINGEILIFSYGAMAVDETDGPHSGRLYLVYTDATPDLTETDVWLIYSDDGGTSWSSAQRMNDDEQPYAVDQFHPWLTVDPAGRVWIVLYDRRNDPNNYLIDVYFTASEDGGDTWLVNERITDRSFDPRLGSDRAGLLGEYIGLCASDNRAHVVWTDTRLGDQDAFGTVLDSVFVSAAPHAREGVLPATPTLTGYPNPTNSTIHLCYNLPKAGPAVLSLYNTTGQEVWRRPLGFVSAGLHHTQHNLSNLATGLYIAQIEAGRAVARTKLILIK